MAKKTYAAPFTFGTKYRTTERTYACAWAIFKDADSQTPVIGFAARRDLAEKQIAHYQNRGNGWGFTGHAEIASVCVVAK